MSDWWADVEEALERLSDEGPDPWAHLDLGQDDIQRWGYAGLFGIVLLRSASVVLPMPGGGLIFAAGGLLDPVWGIPAPIVAAHPHQPAAASVRPPAAAASSPSASAMGRCSAR